MKQIISFNAVQNNTSLKPNLFAYISNFGFNAVQNNTSLKLPYRLKSKALVLMQFKITHL